MTESISSEFVSAAANHWIQLSKVPTINTTWIQMRAALMKDDIPGVLSIAHSTINGMENTPVTMSTIIGYFLSSVAKNEILDPNPIETFVKAVELILENDGFGATIDRTYFADWILYDAMKHAPLAFLIPQITVFASQKTIDSYKALDIKP